MQDLQRRGIDPPRPELGQRRLDIGRRRARGFEILAQTLELGGGQPVAGPATDREQLRRRF